MSSDAAAAVRIRPEADPARRQAAELEALHETALGLIERLELSSLLEVIVERASALVGANHGYLYLVDREEDVLVLRVGTGVFADARLVNYRLPRGEGVGGHVFATGEPIVVDDYAEWARRRLDLADLGFRAVAGVPLRTRSGVVGVLGLAYTERGRTFGADEVALLVRFAQLASLAFENAQLYAAAQDELLERRRTEDELLDTVARLRRSERELQQAHAETIERLAYAAEFRNAETGRHIERMSRYCELLARKLGLDEDRVELISLASSLHDVGKIAIPDEILLKQGPLTEAERRMIERHAEIGHQLLSGSPSELLDLAATIALTHHERFDGDGYPRRLVGDAIPLEGRIASIADVYDALTTNRVYRPAIPSAQAVEIMREGRGTQFDPLMLDLFLESAAEVVAIAEGRVPSERPRQKSTASQSDRFGRARKPADGAPTIGAEALRDSCLRAAAALTAAAGAKERIELALDALTAGHDERLLASVFVLEHNRLWLVGQRGYREVRDGFSLDQGVMARAVRTGRVQFVPDVAVDRDFIEATRGIRSEVAIPFGSGRDEGGTVGVLNIETLDATLPREAKAMYVELANALEPLLVKARDELGVEVTHIARLCVHASSLRGVTTIADFATRTLARLLDLEAAQLELRRDDGQYRLASFWRRPKSRLEALAPDDVVRIASDERPAGAAFSVIDTNGEENQGSRLLWLPLLVAGGEVGAFVGRAAGPEVPHERIEAATLFAQHSAALVDVAQALRREQRAAATDALTGLLNRRGFDERLGDELARAERHGRDLALVLLDCDALKALNDGGGHELGDEALQTVARCLRASKRTADTAARLGGDEFAILLPETDVEGAVTVAERLRQQIEGACLAGGRRLTATFGVASYPATDERGLHRAADRALYAAKRNGGNRVGTVDDAAN